jgi:hypothetical protein
VFNLKKPISHGILSGLAGGVIASLCCLGPVILASLGLAAMFGLAGFCLLDLRPLFFSLGLAFVAVSAFLHYKRGCRACTASTKHRLAFVAFALIAMAVVYLILMWVVVPLLLSAGEGFVCALPA